MPAGAAFNINGANAVGPSTTFEDLPAIHRRRERNAYREVLTEATAGKRPKYYLQNFHYQSGGWPPMSHG
jgi:hypothetical protein